MTAIHQPKQEPGTALTGARQRPYDGVPALPAEGPLHIETVVGEGFAEYELEIGFGNGQFILDRAAALPHVGFLGLETRRKWVHVVALRAAQRGLKNVALRFADARLALERFAPPGSLQRIFILFPDPWWKSRHAKRLVVCRSLALQASRLLAARGELFIATDVDFRAEAYASILADIPGLIPHGEDARISANPYQAKSQREINCEKNLLEVFRLLYVRGS